MKISEALRKAATYHLWDGIGPADGDCESEFTCLAISHATHTEELWITPQRKWYVTNSRLPYNGAFDHYRSGAERQAARKAFLLKMADKAEEEGL